jgi:hypothetical protein
MLLGEAQRLQEISGVNVRRDDGSQDPVWQNVSQPVSV